LNYTSSDEIRKKFIYDSKDDGISRSYIFGYEKDNPSYEFRNHSVAATTQNENQLNDKKHYPLRGMPIQIEPDFDAPMTDLWAALGE
jgi:hypothetical protein